MLSLDSTVVAAQDQVSADLGGDAAILSMRSGVYYGLDSVGARIWNLIREPIKVIEIRNAILNEYEVEPERCERELLTLLKQLEDEGLLRIVDKPSA